MDTDWLHHITTSTGHTRRSPRSEVSDDVVRMLREMLDRAIRGERVDLPIEGTCMSAAAEGDALLVTAWRGRAPLVTVGVARSDTDALRLWGLLRRDGDAAPDRPPPAPWCAAVLEPGLLLHPGDAAWLGDYERCLAWAWVEHR